MRTNTTQHHRDGQVVTVDREVERCVSYADGDGTVICDRRNPSAWIRSTDVRPCHR